MLTVVAQVYNEVNTGNLKRFLADIWHWADNLVVYDDGSTDGTHEMLQQFQAWDENRVSTYIIRSEDNDFKNEIYHKQMMLDTAKDIGSEWIMWMDADEVIEPRGHKQIRELLKDQETDGYAFHQINLWRSERFYRVDNQYNDGIFVRLWRNNGRLRYDPKPGLHQRPYPLGVDRVKDSDIQIIHYGFASDDSIIRKYRTYKDHGQSGWALDRLINEDGLALRRTPAEFLGRPPMGPDTEIFQTRVASKV